MQRRRALGLRSSMVLALLATVSIVATPSRLEARSLSFEDRVRAQEQIERVYYAHQVGARRPFTEAVPRTLLVAKVRDALKRSAALEKFWGTPITSEALQMELDRIGRGTRFPERLLEIYHALGNDPTLIRECFARPALVERLTRNFFDRDERIHGEARGEAETLRERLSSGRMSPGAPDPRRTVVEARHGDSSGAVSHDATPGESPLPLVLGRDDFERWRARSPAQKGEVGPVVDEGGAYVVRVVLDESKARTRVAVYSVPKVQWEEWWGNFSRDLELPTIDGNAGYHAAPPLPATRTTAAVPCDADDTWDNGILDDYPGDLAIFIKAVWTGSEMLVYGSGSVSAGYRYDPLTDTWRSMSAVGAPPANDGMTMVWAGDRMLLWGWSQYTGQFGVGSYDPVADRWSPISPVGAPSGRFNHSAIWTGAVMVIWGGRDTTNVLNTGARYDPVQDHWQPTSMISTPGARQGHTATWTGSEMIVWGGGNLPGSVGFPSGGRYDPVTDTWQIMETLDAPPGRISQVAVWTGSRLIVCDGTDALGAYGGLYDPATDQWQPMSQQATQTSGGGRSAVWTGSRMLIWGGGPTGGVGSIYDPATDSWRRMTATNAPTWGSGAPAVWTGTRMVVWNGGLTSGGRYDPVANTWTPVSAGAGPPSAGDHAAVWTGTLMVVWGGRGAGNTPLASGGRYDPLMDSWTPTSMLGAPAPQFFPAAVWTGEAMVINGAIYDPVGDSWALTNPAKTSGVIPGNVVWTGSRVLTCAEQYDPVNDISIPVSSVGRPQCSMDRTKAVWTGTEMLVWGSAPVPGTNLVETTSGRYNPSTDTWTPMAGGPATRRFHTAVWAGSRMVVWGGLNTQDQPLKDGGRYDPVTDTWQPIDSTAAPATDIHLSSVWTGSRAIIWDGPALSGRYDPALDTWEAMSTVGIPSTPVGSAVWTGSFMIIWGGANGYRTGGRYALGQSIDGDGDGWSACMGDCNDLDASINPGMGEICDGRDNNCDGVADEPYGDADGDFMGDACDCAPGDATAFALPGEVPAVDWGSTSQITWPSLAIASGSGTVYDVVRGSVGEWPVGSGPSEVCLESGSVDTVAADSSTPATGWYYLVRGRNACGSGTYGRTSSGAVRVTSACF